MTWKQFCPVWNFKIDEDWWQFRSSVMLHPVSW